MHYVEQFTENRFIGNQLVFVKEKILLQATSCATSDNVFLDWTDF